VDRAVGQTKAHRLADEQLGAAGNDARIDRDGAHGDRAATERIVARRAAAACVIEAGRGAPVRIAGHQFDLVGAEFQSRFGKSVGGTDLGRRGFNPGFIRRDSDIVRDRSARKRGHGSPKHGEGSGGADHPVCS
jgi:hypothetical protein